MRKLFKYHVLSVGGDLKTRYTTVYVEDWMPYDLLFSDPPMERIKKLAEEELESKKHGGYVGFPARIWQTATDALNGGSMPEPRLKLMLVHGVVVADSLLDDIDIICEDGYTASLRAYIEDGEEECPLCAVRQEDGTTIVGTYDFLPGQATGYMTIPLLDSPYKWLRKLGLPTRPVAQMLVITSE